ncbi:HAD hydrolase-like protein [Streptomyces sp. NPDC005408]|uniref:HAD family hydrolase n=1 Tax=Streptomyces sp. NPDC005408 TaxID=3155341 RepID=UPI00339FA663
MPHATTTPAASTTMRETLSRARCVVLDLDGPVARVFAVDRAEFIARALLEIAEKDGCPIEDLRHCTDPIAVLYAYTVHMERMRGRDGWDRWDKVVAKMHDALDAYEGKAAESAVPTPGAAAFIRACRDSGRVLSVASNNHEDAATRILERMKVLDCFDGPIVGRPRDATLMKPHPHSLRKAMVLDFAVDRHLMIGDTGTDFQAAGTVGMPFYGYHRSDAGRARLGAAGVGPIATSMTDFHRAAEALDS